MTYTELFELVKDKPWKVTLCETGAECWCRLVTPENPIYDGDEPLNLISWGAVSKDVAEHLVNLHNESLTEKFKFLAEKEIFEFISDKYTTGQIMDKFDIDLSDFDDRSLEREIDKRGYYYFEDEYDIRNYVEDDMDCYVFDRPSEIEEWFKENGEWPTIFENHKSHIASNYREETLDLIERLSEEKGWEWIHDTLIKC